MINVSTAFKAALEDDNRNFSGSCTITLTSAESIPIDDSKLWDNGFVIDDSTSNTGGFDIGSAIAQKFTLRLNNMYDDFTECDFTGAVISNVKVSLDLSDKQESVSKGIFTVNDTSYDGDIITLECLDNMHKFDVSYEKSNLTYPATLLQIVQDACRCCGVTLATDSLQFEYYNYVIQEKPEDNAVTFRDVLTWVGQISGHFWKCNKNGQLSAGWYNMSDLSAGTNIHTLQTNVITDVNVDTDDVVITCVRVVTEDENSNQAIYQSGSDGYAVVIDSNKFITNDNAAEIASMIGGRVVGLRFRPMTVSSLQDPTIEAGDGAVVYDRKLKPYKTFFTNVVFSIDADNQLSNDAESALHNSAERFSEASRIYQSLRKQLSKNKSEWEKSLETLKTAMGEKRGLYPVTEILEDGSSILYLCDQDTVAESKIVVKMNASGWGMSTDGGKTWNTGVLVDGTMIAKILNTIGINADWINTGAIEIKTEDGETIFRVDMDSKSVYMSGDVRIGGKKFSESIDNAITDSKNYADSKLADYSKTVADSLEGLQGQIDGQIETFYYEYEPTLQNAPASQWTTTEERKKHEGDLFFWKPNKETGEGGYAYRFFYDSSVSKWEWVLVQDTDITKALAAAQNAQDTADGKRRTFIVTPYPPYDIGDTWNQENGDILTCVVTRASGTSYVSTDWRKLNKYTDDTVAEEAKKAAEQAKEAAALAKNMVLTLSNDSQSITVDADGKYSTFPATVTQAIVMYGSTDISTDCEYEVTKSSGITGNWNKSNRIYTVTGLSENAGWVEIKATYINTLTVSKRFTVQKVYAGTDGTPGRTYLIELSSYAAKRGADGEISPGYVTAYAYYRDGAETRKTYAGRWKIQTSTDGSTWTDSWTSTSNATSATKNLKNADYNFVKFILYEAGGTTNELDTQTFLILTDISALTQEEIVKILSDNGTWKGLYYSNNHLYISFDAALGGVLTLGGPNNGNGQLKLYDENGNEVLRLNNGGMAMNSSADDAITIFRLLRTGLFYYDSTGKKRKVSIDTGGLAVYVDYTDTNNYKMLKLGKYGLYAAKKTSGVEELWMEGDTSKKWEGYIIRYLNDLVRITANAVYTDGCSMGKNLTTSGTLSVAGTAGLKGGAYVQGSFSFEDAEQTTASSPVRRRPIATAGTEGKKIAYIASGTTMSSEGFEVDHLEIRGQFTTKSYYTRKFYSGSAPSDIRLKENIEDSEVNALELVNRMQVRQFDWKIGGHQNIGFVADELEKIDPNLTLGGGYDENGEMNVKQINSPYLLNYAIKAIQELSVVVENQNKHIEELKRRLS